ncbi:MAG: M14 family metallopeptidase [bacterium]
MKNNIIAILVTVVVVLGGYFIIESLSPTPEVSKVSSVATSTPFNNESTTETSTTTQDKEQSIIGKSIDGRDIIAYHFGKGNEEIIFIGGIHGGYSWNTTLVAYETIDYLKANQSVIPENIKVTVIPILNPDGLYKVVGKTGRFTATDVSSSQATQISGRFNANNVDLNRNFDCDWQTSAKWQNTTVSGGNSTFSEPESLAIKNYIEAQKPKALVVWYSAAGGVYASNCGGSILAETSSITNIYAKASGYPSFQNFDFYTTTGDMVNWLAKKEIPAISVLLTNHTDTEWTKNQKGIDALLQHYAK